MLPTHPCDVSIAVAFKRHSTRPVIQHLIYHSFIIPKEHKQKVDDYPLNTEHSAYSVSCHHFNKLIVLSECAGF